METLRRRLILWEDQAAQRMEGRDGEMEIGAWASVKKARHKDNVTELW